MASRDDVTVAGLPLAAMFFRALDPEVHIQQPVEDGAQVAAGTTLMRLFGNARALLTAERSALNTIQHLTGIATMTRPYVDAIAGTGCNLLAPRKHNPRPRALAHLAHPQGRAERPRTRPTRGVPTQEK